MKIFKTWTLLASLVLLPCFFSCTVQEPESPAEEQNQEQNQYEYRFSIVETKATLNDNGVFWEAGDNVGLFAAGNASVAADVDVTTTPKTIVYSSEAPLADGTMVYAYYPFQEGNTDASATKITIPAVQQGGTRSAMPMAGIPFSVSQGAGSQGTVHFLNLGSVIDFRIYSTKYAGEHIKSITLAVDSGSHAVSGEATLDLTSVDPVKESTLALNWPEGAASSVTLTQSGTVTVSKNATIADGSMYMVVAPGTYSGTITIVTNAASYTFGFTDKVFELNGLRGFNMNLDNAVRESYYTQISSYEELAHAGPCLIISKNGNQANIFSPELTTSNYYSSFTGNSEPATITSQGIPSSSAVDACQLIIEPVSNSSTDYYIKVLSAGNSYLYLNNNSLGSGQNPSTFVFKEDGSLEIKREVSSWWPQTNTYYLSYNNSTFTSSTTASTLYLYRENGILTKQSIQFSETSFTFVINDQTLPVYISEGLPQISDANTAITYSSSDDAVASVHPATGAITINGEGTVIITATAAANDTYYGATASYKLSVWPQTPFVQESERMAAYLDYTDANPYDPGNTSVTYVKQFSSTKSETNRLDMPRPVTLTWTSSQTGNKSVAVYYDANHTQSEPMAYTKFSTTANSVDIYNLIPNRHYYYVITIGNTTVDSGDFYTSGHRRIINVADSQFGNCYANNCRDLGGLETLDGRRIKYGKIFRGTNMDRTTSAQQTYIKNVMGVGLDVDLRYSPVETASSDGSYMFNALGFDQIPKDNADVYEGHTQETYNSINDLTGSSMKNTLTRIINAATNNVGVYIHCKVGADRTGFVCLMLEAILGVPQSICDVDYELTSFCAAVDGGNERERGNTSNSWYYYPRGVERINQRSGDTFQARAIDYVVNVLGVSADKVTAFQNCMLEPAQ